MGEVLGGLKLLVILFGIFLFLFLGIILPISVYSAQKWAYRCCKELEKLNQKMDRLLSERKGQVI